MHLLTTQDGTVSDGSEPVDIDQSPADVVFVSAADTELAALASANADAETSHDFLRLAQLSWLSHPYSTDLYIEKTLSKSRMVVVRALGGLPYWNYCLEQMASKLPSEGVKLVLLPGDDKVDEDLFDLSSVDRSDWEFLLGYCVQGGAENYTKLLTFCRYILDGTARPLPPELLLQSGLYWPNTAAPSLHTLKELWHGDRPVCAVVFYRALLQSGNTQPIDELIQALQRRRVNAMPIFVASLKDPISAETLTSLFTGVQPDIVLNLTSFAVGSPGTSSLDWKPTVLDKLGRPVIQAIMSSMGETAWEETEFGLSARDIAMNLSLPEVDGRLTSRAIAFKAQERMDAKSQCPVTRHQARLDRVEFVADLAANWIRLASKEAAERRVAILFANYPNKDGRIANGVGLDAPASAVGILQALSQRGYSVGNFPVCSQELMQILLAGPTNSLLARNATRGECRLHLDDYHKLFAGLPSSAQKKVIDRWGSPKADPFADGDEFILPAKRFGNICIGIQPARGFNINPVETYHSPDLPPPHGYLAFYFWLRESFCMDAVIHLGKHGNLEWLPGKASALSSACFPEAALGPMPNIYPFIVNDPGEGTQAKRRSQAVVIDHLTPPLTRAETYGVLRELEILIDEYYEAAGVDARRVQHLRQQIMEVMESAKIDRDLGVTSSDGADSRLRKLDAYLCELKESQIRDGLHIFGESPDGSRETDLLAAFVRIPRSDGRGENASILRALADDLNLASGFDPLDCDMGAKWEGRRPAQLAAVCGDPWRSNGDSVERLEKLATKLIEGKTPAPGIASELVMQQVRDQLAPCIRDCGPEESHFLMTALDGHFVPPGPSGAPSRGRPDVLPTGRNFYSVDSRTLPTVTAWTLGWKSASQLIERHVQDHGDWPRTMVLTAWGTSNMRTGGDDIAQALALMGVRPTWAATSGRVIGFEILPLNVLGRPRVDVTLRVSGFFRDAFPTQMDLVASAAHEVMHLDEPAERNPAAANYNQEKAEFGERQAGFRVFGSKPGAYGAGLQALIDERIWSDRSDLGNAYIDWGGYAYGSGAGGIAARGEFSVRLKKTEIVVQNQDNREHDLLDSDDYYQFEGGTTAAVASLRGEQPVVYHNDHSRPERPVIRTLEEEISRVVRSRVVNPKWIEGIKRHGYKGAFEMAATVDYMFAFAATTGAVKSHHFDLVYSAYLEDEGTRTFIHDNNPSALHEIADKLNEAINLDLWQPRLNSVRRQLAELADRNLKSSLVRR